MLKSLSALPLWVISAFPVLALTYRSVSGGYLIQSKWYLTINTYILSSVDNWLPSPPAKKTNWYLFVCWYVNSWPIILCIFFYTNNILINVSIKWNLWYMFILYLHNIHNIKINIRICLHYLYYIYLYILFFNILYYIQLFPSFNSYCKP